MTTLHFTDLCGSGCLFTCRSRLGILHFIFPYLLFLHLHLHFSILCYCVNLFLVARNCCLYRGTFPIHHSLPPARDYCRIGADPRLGQSPYRLLPIHGRCTLTIPCFCGRWRFLSGSSLIPQTRLSHTLRANRALDGVSPNQSRRANRPVASALGLSNSPSLFRLIGPWPLHLASPCRFIIGVK